MKPVLSADFDFRDERDRIWGIETDGVCAGQQVILCDGDFIAEAITEQHEKGFLVARVLRLIPLKADNFFVPVGGGFRN